MQIRSLSLILSGAVVAALAISLMATGPETASEVSRPETPVILITVESLRYDHIGDCLSYNRSTTPNLCELSQDGVTFTNAYSPGTQTSFSAPSIVLGRTPAEVGLISWRATLHISETETFAEKLQSTGYHTRRYGAHISPPEDRSSNESLISRNTLNRGYEYRQTPEVKNTALPPDKYQINRSTHIWDFVWSPHPGYMPPKEYLLWGNYSVDNHTDIKRIYREAQWDDRQTLKDLYDGQLRFSDEGRIGSIMTRLRQKGIYEDSLIIVNSDHGVGLGEYNQVTHGPNPPYQEFVHVPLIVKFPGNRFAGKKVDKPVSNIDIYPTLCDYINLDCDDKELDGQSLVTTILEEERPPVFVFGGDKEGIGLIDEDTKYLVRKPSSNCFGGETLGKLYRLDKDPYEEKDLSEQKPEKAENLHEKVCSRWKEKYNSRPEYKYTELSEEHVRRLRKLGYLK